AVRPVRELHPAPHRHARRRRDMTVSHSTLLALHAAAGAAGLLLGPVVILRETRALATDDGDVTRSRVSRAYDAAVLAVCVSATVLSAVYRHELWWLIPVSAFCYGLVWLARWAVTGRRRGWTHAYAHGRGGSYIALVTAFVVVALTVDGPLTGAA